ncbi:hypothetical protein EDD85DRAFT_737536, partial [Armillaria nabsnona]
MFHRNGTQKFMNAKLTAEDHRWLMKIAREIDSSGSEKKHRKQLTEYIQMKAHEHQEKTAARLAKEAKRATELAMVDLVFDLERILTMTSRQLDDQLDLWRK